MNLHFRRKQELDESYWKLQYNALASGVSSECIAEAEQIVKSTLKIAKSSTYQPDEILRMMIRSADYLSTPLNRSLDDIFGGDDA